MAVAVSGPKGRDIIRRETKVVVAVVAEVAEVAGISSATVPAASFPKRRSLHRLEYWLDDFSVSVFAACFSPLSLLKCL
jgi:hypothetical protein